MSTAVNELLNALQEKEFTLRRLQDEHRKSDLLIESLQQRLAKTLAAEAAAVEEATLMKDTMKIVTAAVKIIREDVQRARHHLHAGEPLKAAEVIARVDIYLEQV